MTDTVSIDAKRILLRYGAPISVLDKVTEPHRIEFARIVTRTTAVVRRRDEQQVGLLRETGFVEHGYIDEA